MLVPGKTAAIVALHTTQLEFFHDGIRCQLDQIQSNTLTIYSNDDDNTSNCNNDMTIQHSLSEGGSSIATIAITKGIKQSTRLWSLSDLQPTESVRRFLTDSVSQSDVVEGCFGRVALMSWCSWLRMRPTSPYDEGSV
jgi:hypothetical protein